MKLNYSLHLFKIHLDENLSLFDPLKKYIITSLYVISYFFFYCLGGVLLNVLTAIYGQLKCIKINDSKYGKLKWFKYIGNDVINTSCNLVLYI